MKKHLLSLALAALWATSSWGADTPEHADAAILAKAQAAKPAVIQTLRELVLIESGSHDREGLRRLADVLEQRLAGLGGSVERKSVGEGDMLVSRWHGKGSRRLMLIAHMDTVYPKGALATQPLKEEAGRMFGPGIADDKGGIAVILHSIELLRAQGWNDYAELTVLFNPDEEIGSPGSGQAITVLAANHDVVLSFEPTSPSKSNLGEGVLLNGVGIATVNMRVQGKASHAGAPELGRNALLEAANQVVRTSMIATEIAGTQLTWTMLHSGDTRNQVPAEATATADVRLARQDSAEQLTRALQAKVATPVIPDTQTTITTVIGRPPFEATAQTVALAKLAQEVYAELDRPLSLMRNIPGAASDAGFAQAGKRAAVLESLGLPGFGYHARDEFIELDSIAPRLYLTTRLLQRLAAAQAAL